MILKLKMPLITMRLVWLHGVGAGPIGCTGELNMVLDQHTVMKDRKRCAARHLSLGVNIRRSRIRQPTPTQNHRTNYRHYHYIAFHNHLPFNLLNCFQLVVKSDDYFVARFNSRFLTFFQSKLTALYRINRQGWSTEHAISEMTGGGYNFHSIWIDLADWVREAPKF